jgi:hypothetical protein
MASSAASNTRIELQGTGDNAGTWGTKANTVFEILDRVSSGYGSSVAVADGDTTLSVTDYTLATWHHQVWNVTGALTASANLIVPNYGKFWAVRNSTTGSQTLTIKVAGQTGVVVPSGGWAVLYHDGTDVATLLDSTSFQAADADLTAIAALAKTDGNIIVGDGATWVAESGATARASLGLTIGTDVQAYDAGLQSISGLTTTADQMIYTTSSDTYATTSLTSAGRALLDDASASAQRTTLGLGTLATQNANSVAITGGTIDGAVIGGASAAAITGTTITGTNLVGTGSSGIISIFAGNDSNSYIQNTSAGSVIFRTNNGTEQFRINHVDSATSFLAVTGSTSGDPTLRATGGGTAVLRLETDGTGPIQIRTNNGSQTQLEVAHVASAVEYPRLTGATSGNPPTLSAQGAAANLSLSLASKNNAAINVYANGGVVVSMSPPSATPTEYVQLVGSTTGNPVQVNAAGATANIPVSISNKGTGQIGFVQQSAFSFTLIGVTSGVNRLEATNAATGSGAILSTVGSDTNIQQIFLSKGTGVHYFKHANGAPSAQIISNGSAVNFYQINPAATGVYPNLSSAGSDANIDVGLTPKGSGLVRYGAHSAIAAETVTGYITIKDSGGTERKLAVVS